MKILKLLLLALAGLPVAQAADPLALDAARDYLRQARYPAWSSAIEPGAVDPLLDSRIPTRQSRLGPEGAGPRLSVWASTISALPGEAVALYASLTPAGKASLLEAAPTAIQATVTGELSGHALGALGTLSYRDDGVAPDAAADDGVYSARFVLPATRAPKLGQADSVMVNVTALLADEQVRKASGGFQFSNPAARLTGRYLDSVKNGNLVIAAEVEALAPGRVHLSGTLADATGQPVATAQAARALQSGTQWLELSFYGLAFHDRNVAGALTLASASLTSVDGMPNALGPVVTNAHRTAAHPLALFTRAPFNDPELVEQARRLQLDAAAAKPPLK